MSINTTVVEVTPELATTYLKRSASNRRISKYRVDQYATDMARGGWDLNGSTLVFDSAGRMIDGQHRCAACIQANANFKTIVVRGTVGGAQDTIDSGRARTTGDNLAIAGVPSSNFVAAAATMVLVIQMDLPIENHEIKAKVTKSMITEFVLGDAETWNKAMNLGQRLNFLGVNRTAACAFAYLAGPDDEKVQEFIFSIAQGSSLGQSDPRLALRNWASRARGTDRWDHLSAIIKAWNAWLAERNMAHIKAWKRSYGVPAVATAS